MDGGATGKDGGEVGGEKGGCNPFPPLEFLSGDASILTLFLSHHSRILVYARSYALSPGDFLPFFAVVFSCSFFFCFGVVLRAGLGAAAGSPSRLSSSVSTSPVCAAAGLFFGAKPLPWIAAATNAAASKTDFFGGLVAPGGVDFAPTPAEGAGD